MRCSRERGFTLIELLIVVTIIGIIAAIGIPGLLRARMAGNEASAIGSVRAVISAENVYSQQCSTSGGAYAVSLVTLGTGAPAFLSSELTSGNPSVKSGFTFALAASAGAGASNAAPCPGAQTGFYISAVPQNLGTSGSRGFASNQSNAIWQDSSGAAPTEPFATAGTVSPIQ